MKLTLNWLRQYVDFSWSPAELAERLTLLGLEVESMKKIGGEFEGIVVAQVLTRDRHPNADKLSLCRVHDGQGERQIVCGAQNFKAGDKVPLILPGSTLPAAKPNEAPLTIKVGKIRGVESHGMLCSPQELGLPDQVDGLLILREDATVGQPFAEYLGRAGTDVVYDLEITPNRPDWNSVIGIAREISALTGNPLRLPEINFTPAQLSADPIASSVGLRVDDAELCPRYTARLLRGVKIGPSPDWLRAMLEKVGLRSINNVVDVTNYVMFEVGQPLHAFDFRLLGATPKIIVRRAHEGEKFTTLDRKEHTLTAQMLLIADEAKGIALAGVMGGENSEVKPDTTDVLLESAYFKPQNIRATSKKLELRTDASYRFERGADIGICDWASRRAAQLILETAGGALLEEALDAFPAPPAPKQITLRHARASQCLGVDLPSSQQDEFLLRLNLERTAAGEQQSTFRLPTFRVDLKREIDLIEEITRLYGIDKIPSTPPRGALGCNSFDTTYDALAEARRILTGIGLTETQGQTLISDSSAALASNAAPVALRNPLSSDMNVLRLSLLPGLLETMRRNLSHKNGDLALFEIGRVFLSEGGKPREERRLAMALTGRRLPLFWAGAERDETADIFDLKGMLEEFLENFGLRGVTWIAEPAGGPLFLESASIQLGKNIVGRIGQVSPLVAKRHDLRDAALLAELNLDLLLARRSPAKSFKTLPTHPTVRRDVAMLLTETATHDDVLQVVKRMKPANLERVDLFDVFRGTNIPAGQKSVAYAFTYRHPERTLTEPEVNAAHDQILTEFKQRLGATLRET
ncbi:MAG TPA: phenylalanine--tRNA ligase subunit beta [Verrucomicrobiae bacterium]|jgi:phenylalanyl-tRNA synthetase beta chain|nr:phenylalanine--tRNA ligase subunit beta [Verrucomicrobiae bacterium]